MDITIMLGPHKFSLQATLDPHRPSMYAGYYATSVNCCKNIPLQRYSDDSKITDFEGVLNDICQKLLYSTYSNVWIGHIK